MKQEQQLNAPLAGMALKMWATIMLTICQHVGTKMTYIHQQHYITVPSKYVSWIKRYLWRNPLQFKKMTKQSVVAGVRCQMYDAKCPEFKWLYITWHVFG